VRGTTRDPGNRAQIAASGAEALVADPDRVATLSGALEHVSIACVLLGSAVGSFEQLAALHGSRLAMLLQRTLDTTVRGIVYEAAGAVDPGVLRAGAEIVRAVCEESRIPYALLAADPADHGAWLAATTAAVDQLLTSN
jgi:hypothetical protein